MRLFTIRNTSNISRTKSSCQRICKSVGLCCPQKLYFCEQVSSGWLQCSGLHEDYNVYHLMAVNTYILAAIKKKDEEKAIQLLLTPGYDVNTVAKKVGTPLIFATKLGLIPVVERLLSLGADVNWQDKENKTALHHACHKGSAEMVQVLIRAGCNKYKANIHGDHAIHESVISGNLAATQELLNAGVDINSRNTISGYTPLHLAVLYEQEEIVSFLLENSARHDLKTSQADGEVALHYAVQVRKPAIVKILVSHGANIDVMNAQGETPLAIALQEKKIKMARTLIYAGCDMNKYKYMSPLCVACMQNNQKMVRYLLSEGYDVSKDTSFKRHIYLTLEEANPVLMDYMQHRSQNPMTLKETCRLFIRKYFHDNIEKSVPLLPLPKQLKEWILLDVIY